MFLDTETGRERVLKVSWHVGWVPFGKNGPNSEDGGRGEVLFCSTGEDLMSLWS